MGTGVALAELGEDAGGHWLEGARWPNVDVPSALEAIKGL